MCVCGCERPDLTLGDATRLHTTAETEYKDHSTATHRRRPSESTGRGTEPHARLVMLIASYFLIRITVKLLGVN